MKEDDKLASTPASPSTPGGSTFVNPAELSRATKFWNDLQSINKDRATEENLANLSELGGIEALAEELSVDLRRGISAQELENGLAERRAKYPVPNPCRAAVARDARSVPCSGRALRVAPDPVAARGQGVDSVTPRFQTR